MHDGVFNKLTSSAGFVTPPGTFFHLKMLMLMCILLLHCSETSEESKQVYHKHLHLLVIADDLLRLQRLLLHGASFAKRMIVHSPISELFASYSRDPFGSGTCMVNGKLMYYPEHFTLLFICSTNVLVCLLTVNMKNCLTPKIRKLWSIQWCKCDPIQRHIPVSLF